MLEIPSGDLPDDERMQRDFFLVQHSAEFRGARSKVVHSNRGIGHDHLSRSDRPRRPGRYRGMEPPSAARRRAASRTIKSRRAR